MCVCAGGMGTSDRVNREILGREIKGLLLLTKVSHGLGKFENPYNRSKYCDIGKKTICSQSAVSTKC